MGDNIFRFGQGKASPFGGLGSSTSSMSSNRSIGAVLAGSSDAATSSKRAPKTKSSLDERPFHDFDSGYQGDSDQQWDRSKKAVADTSDDEMEYEEEDDDIDCDYESYTTSLSPSMVNYNYENGRRYHCYKEGEYILPNDEIEQERLDLNHHIFRMCLGGELHLSPVKDPKRILDLGTGTGIWAIDMADEFPDAYIIGNDLSAIQPSKVPPNLIFEIDDCESLWPYTKPFDFVHARTLSGAIRDWPALYAQAYQNLNPGGWFEATDIRMKTYCVGGHKPGTACVQLAVLYRQAIEALGKHPDVAKLHKQFMVDAGFVNVQEKIVHIPHNSWPVDKKKKEIGIYQMYNLIDAIPSYGLAALTRILGMPRVEAEVLLAAAKTDCQNPENKFYSIAHFVIGQKPPVS